MSNPNPPEIIALHCREGGSNKFYAVYINETGTNPLYQVVTAHGAVHSHRAQGTQIKHGC